MRTNPSASNPIDPAYQAQFSARNIISAQASRLNQSFSANDLVGLGGASTVSREQPNRAVPPRSSSMVFPQATTPGGTRSPETSNASIPPLHLDGTEPRIFPGVVSRARSSTNQRPSRISFSEADVAGYKNTATVEDPEQEQKTGSGDAK